MKSSRVSCLVNHLRALANAKPQAPYSPLELGSVPDATLVVGYAEDAEVIHLPKPESLGRHRLVQRTGIKKCIERIRFQSVWLSSYLLD